MVEEKEIRFIDLFAGVGGFHKGLSDIEMAEQESGFNSQRYITEPKSEWRDGQPEKAFRCVWANEWDKYAAQTYRKNFPDTILSTDDIRTVPAEGIPDHQLLCAGFPCQAFSVAGKRRGLEEARGTLFYEIARIAERKRPRILLLENVKGLLSHDEGRTFATILRVMGSIGYRLEWQVLNSKWFGVPQNRERVFIVGHLGEEPTRTVFPITEIGGELNGEAEGAGEQFVNCIDGNYWKGPDKHGQRTMIIDSFNQAIRLEIGAVKTNEASPTSSSNLIAISSTNPRGSGEHREYHLAEEVRCIPSSNAGNNNPVVIERPHGKNLGGEKEPCLRVRGEHSQLLKDSSIARIRRLTPLECERLQGFPDGWTSGVSDTQRYKQMGNAVTVNVIAFLGRRILSIF